jgi:hypothetical protein
MSDVTGDTNHPAEHPTGVPAKPMSSTLRTIIIGIVAVALGLLIAYQFFGCSGCYGHPSI